MPKIKILFFLFLLVFTNGYSHHLGLKHYTTDDGLPSNTIFNLYFDSKGYMWIATDKGVARYNGMEFKTFTTYDDLPDNEVFGFCEDYEGRLWISNFKGALCYYKDNIFHTAANTPWMALPGKNASNFFNLFTPLKDSSIVTKSVDGKSLLVIKNKKIKEISLAAINPFLDLKFDWHTTFVQKLNDNRYSVHYSQRSFIVDTFGNIIKTGIHEDTIAFYGLHENNVEYMHTKSGFLNPYDATFIRYLQHNFSTRNPYPLLSFVRDRQNIFAADRNALYFNQSKILSGVNFSDVNRDNTGNIWLASLTDGIYCINQYFANSYLLKKRLETAIVAANVIDNTIRLVDENGTIFNIPTNLSSLETITPTHQLQPQTFLKTNTLITPAGDVISVLKPTLVYTKNNDKKSKQIDIHLLIKDSKESTPTCKAISYFDSTFYINTMCYLFVLKTNHFLNEKSLSIKTDTLPFNTDVKDRLYFSALNKTDTSFWFSLTDRMNRLKNKAVVEEKALQKKTFRQFKFYGHYLAGFTDNGKFYIYNTVSKALDSVSEPNCVWESIYSINDSVAFINTSKNYKLLTFYPSSKNTSKPYQLATIENPFIPQKADFIFADGKTYYFIKNGELSGFPAAMITAKPLPPKPIFVSVKTGKKSYAAVPTIELPYSESKTITIQINAVSFNDDQVMTEYSISKDESDSWNDITGNEINLNAIGLGYGKYTIKLRSRTNGSDFSKPTVLMLQIATPFWAKWWFIALCGLAFILLILVIVRLVIWRQVRKRQKEFDAEMKYQQSEYKALNALMNPHFIFNSLNNIQSLINKDHKETANQYLVIFSKLIRQNMLNVSKGYISLHQEIVLIENYLYLEKLRFKELINFTIDIDEEIDTETVMIPPLLIQPVVENAIIHGLLPMQSEDSQLNIRIFEIEEVIHVEIIDNGIGLNQSLKKKNADSDSYGLSNLHRRIEHVKKFQKSNIEFEIKELVDDNGKTLGTQANITIEQL